MTQPTTGITSIPHALAHWAEHRGEDPAFAFLGTDLAVDRELTYRQLARAAQRVAAFLRTRTRRGDRALLLFPPGGDYLAAFLGCLSAGVIAVPLYPPRPGAKLDRIGAVILDCRAPVALTTSAMVPLLGDLPSIEVHAVEDMPDPGHPADHGLPTPDEIAFLQYTSGSTGQPKGVMVSHRNLGANLGAIGDGFGVRPDDVILSWLPMYHDMGLIGTTLLPLFLGRKAVLLNTFEFIRDPLSWPLAMDAFGATCSGGPNFAYQLLLDRYDEARLSGLDLRRWRIAFNGAEPVRAATMAEFAGRYARHGFAHRAFQPCYGLAEATLFVSGAEPMTGYRATSADRRSIEHGRLVASEVDTEDTVAVVSSGAAATDTTIVIRGEDGGPLSDGLVGEICVRGPGVAQGYWDNPAATQETFQACVPGHSGSFLRTGDLGALVGGQLHVVGRTKDLIIVNGRNFYPHDVEAAATSVDARLRTGSAAAFQVDDRGVVAVLEVTREAVAELNAEPAALDAIASAVRREVSAVCGLDLADLVFVYPHSIPKTSSGKIRRAEANQRFQHGKLRVVGRRHASRPAPDPGTGFDPAALLAMEPRQRRSALRAALRPVVTAQVGFELEPADLDRPLAALGLDSLKLVALKGAVEGLLGRELDIALFFGHASLSDVIDTVVMAPAEAAPVAEPAPRSGPCPVTESQLQLQFYDQLHPDDRANTLPCALRFARRFDESRLHAAVARAVATHPALRTTLRDGIQHIDEHSRFDWDSRELGDTDAEAARDFLAEVTYRPFDLAEGPLVRAAAVLTPTSTTLLLACHHAVVDYASLRIVLADVVADLVGAKWSPPKFALADGTSASAADWADAQAQSLAKADGTLAELVDRWRPVRDRLLFPAPMRPRRRNPAATVDFEIGAERTGRLYERSRARGFTPFVTVAAAYLRALHRVSGARSVTIGTLHHGRTDRRFASTVGYLVNPVPLAAEFSDGDGMPAVEERTWRELRAALRTAEVPFARLVRALKPERHGQNPLFQATLTFQQSADGRLGDGFAIASSGSRATVGGVDVDVVDVPPRDVSFAISLYGARDGDRMVYRLVYQRDLVSEATARRVAEQFRLAIDEAVGIAATTKPVTDLSPEPTLAGVPNLAAGFARAVERHPDRIALRRNGTGLSYRDLEARVAELAGVIRSQAADHTAPVGILLDRSIDMIVAALAIVRTGAPYVPIDPATPPARIAFILADATPSLVITSTGLADRVPEGVAVIAVDQPLPRIAPMPAAECPSTWDSRAYVIFTSGTTGRPKGVQVSHGNVLRLFTATEPEYEFSHTDVWSLFHSFAFDFSVWEMWGPLLYGGCLVVIPQDVAKDPAAFRTVLASERVTILSQTPTAFNALITEDARHPDRLPLRRVVFGGEALHFSELKRWVAKYGDSDPQLINMYGITETTVHASYRQIHRTDLDHSGSLIGSPLSDLDFVLVDDDLNPVPDGEIGEIVVVGGGVALGYLNRPELTQQRFIQLTDGTRGYRSGDLAAITPTGEYTYHGRKDNQVKIRGYRIELGEIRAALDAVPGVRQAAVIVTRPQPAANPVVKRQSMSTLITDTRDLLRGTAPEPPAVSTTPKIVAYVVGDDRLATDVLFGHLRAHLPEYMIPAFVVAVDAIPTNHNGKVDTDRLPAPTAANCLRELIESTMDDSSASERLMCAIFEEVLGTTGVRPDDSFFAIGGDSIVALQLRAAALNRGMAVELADIYALQTPRAIAAAAGVSAPAEINEPVAPFAQIGAADRALVPDGVVDAYPVGILQAGFLFHSAYQTDVNMYCDVFMFRFGAPYDHDAMTQAVARAVAKHEMLRTSFDFSGYSEPLQLVHATAQLPTSHADLRHLDAGQQEAELAAWRDKEKLTPHDWSSPPLVRFAVHVLSDAEFQFSMSFHDATLDGWSESVMMTGILTEYWALLHGRTLAEIELPVRRYADFIAAEREVLNRPSAREFWTAELADVEPTRLPQLANGSSDVHDGRMGFLSVDLPPELSARLDELAGALRVSLKHVLVAVHARVQALLTGRSEVVLGIASNGRVAEAGGTDALGVHINLVPYRLSTQDLTWTELANSVLAKDTQLLETRGFPYAEIRRIAGVSDDLFDASFNFTHFHGYERLAAATGIEVLDAKAYMQTSFSLRVELNKDPFSRLLALDLEANLERVSEPQLRQIGEIYRNALAHAGAEPGQIPTNRDLIGEPQWGELLAGFAGPVDPPADTGFFPVFDRSVAANADRVAAACGTDSMTYAELAARVGAFAGWLAGRGVRPGMVVGLRAGRDLDYLVATMAIMRVGAVYLPLPSGPAARVASMLRRSGAELVLYDTVSEQVVRAAAGDLDTVELGRAMAASASYEPYRGRPPRGTDGAYVIFTSGSTGEPKGAQIRHDGMLNHLLAKIDVLKLTSADRVSQDAAATFDISLWQWLAPLAVGATTVIYPDELSQDPPRLLRAVAQDAITVLEVAPSVLSVFSAELTHYGVAAFPPFALRWVASSGETLKPKAANEFRRLLPEVRLLNMWGITETSDDCTHYELTGHADEHAPSVPVGAPIANSAVYVLDESGQPVPVGTPGELYVGGVCAGAGYVNDEERTSAAFVPDPFAGPGTVMYRTGDRGRQLADGGYEFLGRRDSQLKVRGQRVELGEVERALAGVGHVQESAVVARTNEGGDTSLVGFFVPAAVADPSATEVARHDLSTSDVRTELATVLPRYAVPDILVRLDELPRTMHGKVDTKALRGLDVTGPASTPGESQKPATPTESVVLDVIASVLRVRPGSPTADFFEQGGHSLHATQVMARLRDHFGLNLPLRLLFEHRTAAGLAAHIDAAPAGRGTPARALDRIERRPAGTTRFPLALNQASLWFLHQVDPDDRGYDNTSLLHIRGPLDVDAMRFAVDTLARRHEVLSMRFGSQAGVPFQTPVTQVRVALEVEEVDAGVGTDSESILGYVRRRAAQRAPFDLARGPLVTARLYRFSATEHVLEWSSHHIVSDGWSTDVAIGEIREAYLAHREGRAPRLPELEVQYADYALWQQRFLTTTSAQSEVDFWKSYLDGYPGELALVTDFPRTDDRSRDAGYATRTWDGATTERVREFAAGRHTTPFLVGHAVTAVAMATFTQQSDVVLGAVVAGRTVPRTEPLIGFFANTLPLRYSVNLTDTPAELVAAVTRSGLSALEHQLLPFGRIVDSSGVARTPGTAPLVQVLVTFDNYPLDLTDLPGLSSTLVQVPPRTSQFDLLFRFVESDRLTLTVQYDSTLFTARTVDRLLDAVDTLFEFFLDQPDRPLSAAAVLGDENPAESAPALAGVPNLATGFARTVERYADRIALRCNGTGLSYRDLDTRVAELAGVIRSHTTNHTAPIGILLDRSIDMIVAALAIVRTGAPYVPIDPATPPARMTSILTDAQPSLVITSTDLADHIPDEVAIIAVDQPLPEATPLPTADCPSTWDSQAYVIFTSGTTGRPKGVQVSHGNLLRLFTSTEPEYQFNPNDVWTLFHSFAFDFSVWEMWGPLLYGGCVVVVPQEVAKDPVAFRTLLANERVTILSQTPTAFNQLIAEDTRHPDQLPLRRVIFGGEALHFTDLTRWVAKYGDTNPQLINMYGITETTVHASYRQIHRSDLDQRDSLIGQPLRDLNFLLVDDHLNPVPDGHTGEIIVTGAGVALGYLNRPDLTQQRFIQLTDGTRGYRSGDLAAITPTGEYTYHGRKDNQVKIRGYRIELGEVEGALRGVPGLAEAAVVARELPAQGTSLVAYVVTDGTGGLATQLAIRRQLKRVLPHYMIPARFEFLDALPMNANGKLDRDALPEPGAAEDRFVTRPMDELTERVHGIVAGLLGQPSVPVTAGFFELGGHSLLATRVLAGVHEAFGIEVPLRDFLRAPTIHALAEAVRTAGPLPAASSSALLRLHDNDEPAPVVVAIPGVLGFGLSFAQLSATMADQPWYAVNLNDLVAVRGDDLTLPALVDDIAGLVTDAARGRPVHVVGHSFGGTLGFCLVTALRARGQEVASLVLLDAVEPARLAAELADTEAYRMWEFLTHVATVFPDATTRWADALPGEASSSEDDIVALAERLLGSEVAALFDRGLVAAFHDYLRTADLRWPDPVPLSCPTLLIKAGTSRRQDLGWSALLPDSLVHRQIDASHIGMVQAPHAGKLAAMMTEFFAHNEPQTLREAS